MASPEEPEQGHEPDQLHTTTTAVASGSNRLPNRPQLRFRQANPHSVSEEPAPRSANAPRRASSVVSGVSETSYDRTSIRSSTDDFFRPRPQEHDHEELHQEPSIWHSSPLLFALVPAIGGVLFKRGSAVITDIALLGFAAIYLNWCLITPWYWYHSAQTVRVKHLEATADDDELHGEPAVIDDDDQETGDEHGKSLQDEKDAAMHELRLHELFAFSLCIAGPLLGAYLLHLIRNSLSQFGDDMVSSLHLTLFVLAAELRPLRHVLKMVQARTLHLQRTLREDPFLPRKVDDKAVHELTKRLAETESSLAIFRTEKATAADSVVASTAESIKKSQNIMQSQIDALTRAVRRYEKRATAQTIQNEARMQDLENRLRDALSLAAAAANYSQQPGLLLSSIEWLTALVWLPLAAAWSAITYPFRLASRTIVRTLMKTGLVQANRRRRNPKRTGKASETERERLGSKSYKR